MLLVCCLSYTAAAQGVPAQIPTPTDAQVGRARSSAQSAEGAESEEDDAFDPLEWFILPLIGFTSDVGFAGALLAMVFHYDEDYAPYRDKVQVITTLTTRLVQYHQLIWERVGIFGLPLRLETNFTFGATPVGHYCGIGNQASCDRETAIDAARQSGLRPGTEESNEFINNYYRFRVMRPTLRLTLRWRPTSTPLELQFQWLGDYGISGFVGERGPYPGSLYGQDYPDGEAHFLSELRGGVVYDQRDQERRPSDGYLLAGTLRISSRAIGSYWDFFGINLTAAHYTSLDRRHRFVIANRAVADVAFGDVPTTELGALGGFWSDVAFGGTQTGRGIRARRFIGRIKLIAQSELRWAFLDVRGRFQLLIHAFGDVAWVGESVRDFGGELSHLLTSFGGGVTAYWGQNFILRFDVGLSPEEDYSPQFYLNLLHPY